MPEKVDPIYGALTVQMSRLSDRALHVIMLASLLNDYVQLTKQLHGYCDQLKKELDHAESKGTDPNAGSISGKA